MSVVSRAVELAALLVENVDTPELVKPDSRAEAGELLAEIDQAIRDLYRVREALVGAVRVFDDARDQRIDAWLERRRGQR